MHNLTTEDTEKAPAIPDLEISRARLFSVSSVSSVVNGWVSQRLPGARARTARPQAGFGPGRPGSTTNEARVWIGAPGLSTYGTVR